MVTKLLKDIPGFTRKMKEVDLRSFYNRKAIRGALNLGVISTKRGSSRIHTGTAIVSHLLLACLELAFSTDN